MRAASVNTATLAFRGTPALKRAIEAAAKRIAKARKLPGYTASDFLRETIEGETSNPETSWSARYTEAARVIGELTAKLAKKEATR